MKSPFWTPSKAVAVPVVAQTCRGVCLTTGLREISRPCFFFWRPGLRRLLPTAVPSAHMLKRQHEQMHAAPALDAANGGARSAPAKLQPWSLQPCEFEGEHSSGFLSKQKCRQCTSRSWIPERWAFLRCKHSAHPECMSSGNSGCVPQVLHGLPRFKGKRGICMCLPCDSAASLAANCCRFASEVLPRALGMFSSWQGFRDGEDWWANHRKRGKRPHTCGV